MPVFLSLFSAACLLGFAYQSYRLFSAQDELARTHNKLEKVLDDAAKLAAQIPKHDEKGRFKKKS